MAGELYVCRKCKGADRLVERIERRLDAHEGSPPAVEQVEVHRVRCQDICKGPVAGIEVDGEMYWFKRLRDGVQAKAMAKLIRRAGRGPVPKKLRPHHLRHRDGRRVRR